MYFTVNTTKSKRIHIDNKIPVKINKKIPTLEDKINLLGPNSHIDEAHFFVVVFFFVYLF